MLRGHDPSVALAKEGHRRLIVSHSLLIKNQKERMKALFPELLSAYIQIQHADETHDAHNDEEETIRNKRSQS